MWFFCCDYTIEDENEDDDYEVDDDGQVFPQYDSTKCRKNDDDDDDDYEQFTIAILKYWTSLSSSSFPNHLETSLSSSS
ncbi:hypothetical protein DERF_005181 [Dermatophagoides farinae]|uniref:Uncharacterized protein n=1 Tax=Dermatophagoides farinae TaxID=6954 RepID=A0A922L8F4_DERFA|nr:hypothetical protein DERF_005181 [Dermatophagoides farinae]